MRVTCLLLSQEFFHQSSIYIVNKEFSHESGSSLLNSVLLMHPVSTQARTFSSIQLLLASNSFIESVLFVYPASIPVESILSKIELLFTQEFFLQSSFHLTKTFSPIQF